MISDHTFFDLWLQNEVGVYILHMASYTPIFLKALCKNDLLKMIWSSWNLAHITYCSRSLVKYSTCGRSLVLICHVSMEIWKAKVGKTLKNHGFWTFWDLKRVFFELFLKTFNRLKSYEFSKVRLVVFDLKKIVIFRLQ